MTETLAITGVAHIGIRVHDLVRSRAFYEKLGFVFVAGPMGPEPVAILSHPGGVEINLVLNGQDADAPNVLMDTGEKHAGITHVALAVANMDDTIARLTVAGIPLSGGPDHFIPGQTSIFVRDPDRNVIEFHHIEES